MDTDGGQVGPAEHHGRDFGHDRERQAALLRGEVTLVRDGRRQGGDGRVALTEVPVGQRDLRAHLMAAGGVDGGHPVQDRQHLLVAAGLPAR